MTTPISNAPTRIAEAFGNLYPNAADVTDGIVVTPHSQIFGHYLIEIEDGPTFRGMLVDGHIRCALHDPDFEAEYPDEDSADFMMIRISL